jgi:hypothetical protein
VGGGRPPPPPPPPFIFFFFFFSGGGGGGGGGVGLRQLRPSGGKNPEGGRYSRPAQCLNISCA